MVTMGGSDQSTNETSQMTPKSAKQYFIPVDIFASEFKIVSDELNSVIVATEKFAATHGKMPLPLTFLRPQSLEENSSSRLIHSALIKLDELKATITVAQWQSYNEQYANVGNHHANKTGERQFHFNVEMLALVKSIGDYIQSKSLPVPRVFWGDKPSARAIGTIAVLHAAAWLTEQAQVESGS